MAAALAMTAAGSTAPTAAASAFQVSCPSSHVAGDDPIVFPGLAGAAHRHEFFGATNADAHSTTQSLLGSPTTCLHHRDTAAYWTPSLEVVGRLRRGRLVAYYQRAGKDRAAAPPLGLRMIAGAAGAASPQPLAVTSWQCTGIGSTRSSAHSRTIPRCLPGQQLSSWVRFPDCWDGRRLDSPDHASHMAYARAGRCPATHPVELMRLVIRVTWPTRPRDASVVRLGGGMLAPTAMHADFWNSWHMPTLRQLRWDCIEVARPCGELTTPP
jgi:hypothetical protein